MQEKNIEIDVTRFVNIDSKPYDIYIGGKVVRHLEAGEDQIVPIYVGQVGAKHLVDRVLQEQHGIKDTNADTPLRKSLFAKILPDLAQELAITPLSEAEERKEIKKQIKAQEDELKAMKEERAKSEKEEAEKDKRIKELEKAVEKLSEAVKKKAEK